MDMLENGVMPSNEQLAAAGISSSQAEALVGAASLGNPATGLTPTAPAGGPTNDVTVLDVSEDLSMVANKADETSIWVSGTRYTWQELYEMYERGEIVERTNADGRVTYSKK